MWPVYVDYGLIVVNCNYYGFSSGLFRISLGHRVVLLVIIGFWLGYVIVNYWYKLNPYESTS